MAPTIIAIKASIILIAIVALTGCAHGYLVQKEIDGIRAMMKSMPGLVNPFGPFKWDPNHPEQACCFKGIQCDRVSHPRECEFDQKPRPYARSIIYINLQGFVDGVIPDEIANFQNLTRLQFQSAGVTGAIPASISQLKNLKTFYAYNNLLTGPLPNVLPMEALEEFTVRNSLLDGTLPASWSAHPNLWSVDLTNNQLQGTIPPSWKSFDLNTLSLSQNQLKGPIDTVLAWDTIKYVALSNNFFSGPLPASFGETLSRLHVDGNALSGTIPNYVLKNDLVLNFRNNSLEGPIPDIFSATVDTFDVSYNKLTGPIPNSLAQSSIMHLGLNNNQLTLCPPPQKFEIGWAGTCDISSQKVTPPCSCMEIYKQQDCQVTCSGSF